MRWATSSDMSTGWNKAPKDKVSTRTFHNRLNEDGSLTQSQGQIQYDSAAQTSQITMCQRTPGLIS